MGVFKEMDPGEAMQAIEGHDDVLAAAAERLDSFYDSFRCPRCKCELQKEFDTRHAYAGGGVIARSLLRCGICSFLLEPHNNIVVEYGDASKIPVESIPIIDGEES